MLYPSDRRSLKLRLFGFWVVTILFLMGVRMVINSAHAERE